MAIQPTEDANPRPVPWQLSQSIKPAVRAITSLQYISDGSQLVSASSDGHIQIWNASDSSLVRSFRAHRTGINDMSISPDSLYISTASDDGTSRIFLLQEPSDPLRVLSTHTAPVLAVAYSPKGNLIATGSFDESAIIWDVRRSVPLRALPAHADAVWSVGWDNEGGMVVTGSADGLIRLWDSNTGQCLRTLDNETNSPVSFVSFTKSSFFLLSSTLSSTLRIYNFFSAKVSRTFTSSEYHSDRYPCPVGMLLPDANREEVEIIAGSENGKIIIWDVGTREVTAVLEGSSRRPIVALAVSPDGKTISVASSQIEPIIDVWRISRTSAHGTNNDT